MFFLQNDERAIGSLKPFSRLKRFVRSTFIALVNIALLTLAAFGVSGAVACVVHLFGR